MVKEDLSVIPPPKEIYSEAEEILLDALFRLQ